MDRLLILIVGMAWLLAACGRERKVLPEHLFLPDSSGSIVETKSTGNEKTFSGLFVVGKTLLSFRRCNEPDRDFAVADSTGQMKELYRSLVLNSPAFPFEYVFAELRGTLAPATEALALRGFDSILTVTQVLTFEQKNYQNSCIPYDFWAIGEGWSLQISSREGVLVLKDYSTTMAYVFEYFAPANAGDDVYTYASNNYAMQASIKAVIRKEPCTDLSGTLFEYSATALVNGKTYRGCGIRGSSL
jgi:uncharacterized membrane protein